MHLSELILPSRNDIFFFTSRFLISICTLFLASCITVPQTDNVVKKSEIIFIPSQLREDLAFVNNSLKQIHPEPFSRFDQEMYQGEFERIYADLSWPQRRSDFYRKISPLVAQFSDIHTRLRLPQQEYVKFVEQSGKFPLAVLYSTEGLIVVADQHDYPVVPVGSEITSINNISVKEILKKFSRYIPFETESGQRRMIQMEFSRLLWSIYKFDTDYQVDYQWQGKNYSKSIKGIKQQLIEPHHSNIISHYGGLSINEKTSLLWFNDFNEEYDKFDQFLSKQFADMRAQNKQFLVLDLRYNRGGITDNLALLLTYLTAEPVNWATSGIVKLSDPFRRQHSELLGDAKKDKYGNYLGWLPVEYLNLLQWEILFASDGDWVESEIDPVVSNNENYFQGKIFVLSNGYCFSACASLVATLQSNQLATIIGEPPGSLTDVQYGYPVEVELPNSGLKLVIPAMKFILSEKSEGLRVPDYPIERSKKDVLLGRDPVLEMAIKLSKQQ